MKLIRARVTNYRAIDDSGWVNINEVTSMVGKNESGKTAFLQALRRRLSALTSSRGLPASVIRRSLRLIPRLLPISL